MTAKSGGTAGIGARASDDWQEALRRVPNSDLQVRVFPYLLDGSRRILPENLPILLLTIFRPSGKRKS
jgi:hypothetical protein